MTPSLLRLPAHVRRGLASALESGMLPVPCTEAAAGSVLNLREGAEEAAALVEELRASGIDGKAAAAWIRTVEEEVARVPAPDLVWSGPEVPGLHARDTRRVYEELLGQAARSLWASTFAYFDGQRAFEVLARRMDEVSDLQVKLLLNIQRGGGDTTAPNISCGGSRSGSGPRIGRGSGVLRCSTIPGPWTRMGRRGCCTPRRWWRMTRRCSSPRPT